MFTGIVQGVGTVRRDRAARRRRDHRVRHGRRARSPTSRLGGSIAVSGVCLTATPLDARASPPTSRAKRCRSRRSAAGRRQPREPRDGAAGRDRPRRSLGHRPRRRRRRTWSRATTTRARCAWNWVPPELARYIARKGSVCSTASASPSTESRAIASPSTSFRTRWGHDARRPRPATRVNLEVDIIARYVERMLEAPAC